MKPINEMTAQELREQIKLDYMTDYIDEALKRAQEYEDFNQKKERIMETEKSNAGKTTELIMLLINQYIAQDVQSYNRVYEAVLSSIKLHDKHLQPTEAK